MGRKSRYSEYAKGVYGEQGDVPALSIKEKLSQMREKAKEINKKSEKKEENRSTGDYKFGRTSGG